jgi:phospholipid transport system substrate-binding protein
MTYRNAPRWLAISLLLMVGWTHAAETPSPAQTTQQPGPEQIVSTVAQDTLRDLDANRAEYRKDPDKLRAVVDKNMLPYFDTEFMARSVLGVHWPRATEEQRRRFIDAFYRSLFRSYGESLLDFRSDRLRIIGSKQAADGKTATVRTRILRDNGKPIAVNYQLRQTPQHWKAFDVSIEGVSYLTSYKRDFGAEISARGLDALITRLESLAAAAPAAAKAKN